MFFVLSKLLLIFILPVTWITAFLLAAVISKRPNLKRKFLITSVVLLLIFTNPYLLNSFAKLWNIKAVPLKNSGHYSCAIVLGGFSSEGPNGTGFFNGASDRFIEGLKLFTTGKVSHILISSGNGNLIHDSFAEADWVKTQLKLFNVPDSCVLIENRSRNTIENAAFSKVVLSKSQLPPPYVLVTSAFHMRRSLGIFKKANIDVVPFPCNYMTGAPNLSIDQFIPDGPALGNWNIYIKEIVGTIVNFFK
jgi:uncharacterized SAM-binding protein YcdF (DUF218 family)